MVTNARWRLAQSYERGYWNKRAAQIETGSSEQLDWYRWRSERLADRLESLGLEKLTSGTTRILEVGHGPVGIVSFFESKQAVGVDPLQKFFDSSDTLSALRSPRVDYLQGVGETLPLRDRSFDLVIIDNCIDHVKSVEDVLTELWRVLRPGGVLFLTVNCRTAWGYWVHRLLARLGADPGHPHSFTRGRIRSALESRFELLDIESDSFAEAWRADLRDSSVKAKAKALLGTSEFVTELLVRKTS